jgi:hypothetical protein
VSVLPQSSPAVHTTGPAHDNPTLSYTPAPEKQSLLHSALWAVFLGASWTWIIGMFLPVLLVRDYGLAGWIVFALPNVVGAAAMAWVLHDAQASRRFVERHQAACRAFSWITIAYHVFFVMWMLQRFEAANLRGWGFFALGLCAVASIALVGNFMRWVGAIGAMIASGVMCWMLYQQQNVLKVPSLVPRGHEDALWKAACLFPTFALGFVLCPYLDLTFHRARQHTSPAGGRAAFGLGFGVVFLSMIVLTLLYAQWLLPAVDGSPRSKLASLFLVIHLMVQSAFTVGAHVREVATRSGGRSSTLLGLTFIVCMFALGWYASTPQRFRGHDLGEVVYWCLLGFYGLLFPAYLLTRSLRSALIVSAIAFPLYWMGYVEGKPIWLLPGVVVVLVSGSVPRLFQREPGGLAKGLRLGSRGTP